MLIYNVTFLLWTFVIRVTVDTGTWHDGPRLVLAMTLAGIVAPE